MLTQIRIAFLALLVLTILTGLLYPLAITAIAAVAFPHEANGGLLHRDGQLVGSRLIGQPFDSDAYFWPRPSATGTAPYNAAASSGSNWGPLSEQLAKDRESRAKALQESTLDRATTLLPAELLAASGSGLDPDITVEGADFQAARVAKARGLDQKAVDQLIAQNTTPRQLGVLGEPRVNVLSLNLALDRIK